MVIFLKQVKTKKAHPQELVRVAKSFDVKVEVARSNYNECISYYMEVYIYKVTWLSPTYLHVILQKQKKNKKQKSTLLAA